MTAQKRAAQIDIDTLPPFVDVRGPRRTDRSKHTCIVDKKINRPKRLLNRVYGVRHRTRIGHIRKEGVCSATSLRDEFCCFCKFLMRATDDCSRHPRRGKTRVPISPIRLHASGPAGVDRPAPLLGQDTDRVLSELLGVTNDELAALHASGVIEPVKS